MSITTSNPMNAELTLEDPVKSFTTSQINQMLWNRYTEKGEYVFLFDVPNVVGTQQSRRCDGVAIGMWGSTGRLIQGFEVKASRSDWLREVKDVTKADPFIEQCDRWWLVTGHVSIAKEAEIPAAWGWMVATKTGLRIQRPASPLPQDRAVMKRLWAYALIRRAAERGDPNNTEFQVQLKKATEEIVRRETERADHAIARAQPAYEALRKKIETFEKESGMKLEDWRLGNVGNLARRLHSLDNYSSAGKTLKRLINGLESLKSNAKGVLDALDNPALTGDDSE